MAKPRRALLSPDEESSIREGFSALAEANAYWDAHAEDIQRRFGGEWIVLSGEGILAHARDPDDLDRWMDSDAAARKRSIVRFVPTNDTEYVF